MELLSEADVAALLDPAEAIEASAEAYRLLSSGNARIPVRMELTSEDASNLMLVMPGMIGDRTLGLKVIVAKNDPEGRSPPQASALVLLFDAQRATPIGLLAAGQLTDYRTGAGLAAATRALARHDSRTLVIYGAGRLAFPSALLVSRVRPISRIIVCSRTQSRVDGLVGTITKSAAFSGIEIEASRNPDQAAREADIIVTVTSSTHPVFDGRRVRPGTHINLGGAFRPTDREIDDQVARRASFFVDSMESCRARAGDIVIPLATGAVGDSQVKGEIGEVLSGALPGRTGDAEITVFKSLGVAAQDLILGERILDRAKLSRGSLAVCQSGSFGKKN